MKQEVNKDAVCFTEAAGSWVICHPTTFSGWMLFREEMVYTCPPGCRTCGCMVCVSHPNFLAAVLGVLMGVGI